MDIRRTILLVIFAFSLFMLWNNWQVHQGGTPLIGVEPQQASQSQTTDKSQPGVPNAAQANGQPAVAPIPAQATQSEIVTITTDVLRMEFDLIGAQLVKAELLKFPETNNRAVPFVLLDNNDEHTYIVQTGIVGAPDGQNYPTHLIPFRLLEGPTSMQGDTLTVRFEAESDGVRVTKSFTFKKGSYAIDVDHQIENLTDNPVTPSLYLQITRDDSTPETTSGFYSTFTGAAVYSEEDKFQKVDFSDIAKKKADYIKETNNGWFAMIQHYFVTAWVPRQGTERSYDMANIGNSDLFAIRSIESVGSIAPQQSQTVPAKLWVGPQDQDQLNELAPELGLVVDYGWLTIIARPLFVLMTWIHSLLGNWGWTIVALTVLIKIVFYPLSSASYRSMAKMKQVAPRLQALKEQYGDDRQKMNAAMMEMYRTEKINPLGGCLPMLIQIPVFISLYWVLLASVEMRGAPWVLWVDDLSVRDPLFILPAVMMATMFLQIKLNPTPPDPTQAKVMMIMPLVFGGMMFFFPAGLVLYWCVNNILSIAQQWLITKRMKDLSQQAKR
ncbi:membrane protein insertase YidC [Orrella sp. 11846]|uniref:membrane protein insertase YidC n=1 Tax=Orrella sp. 11846 TaxID=3409913 RepID=UPI003B5A02C2